MEKGIYWLGLASLLFLTIIFTPLSSYGQPEGLSDRFGADSSFRDSTFLSSRTSFPTNTITTKDLKTAFSRVDTKLPPTWPFLSVTPKLGYESNPQHSTNATGSAYFGLDAAVSFVYLNENTELSFSDTIFNLVYQKHGTAGNNTSDADSVQNKVSAGYLGLFGIESNWLVGIPIVSTYTVVNQKAFTDTYGLAPSIVYNWNPKWIATGLTFQYNHNDDLTPKGVGTNNDDAEEYTLQIDNSLLPKGSIESWTNHLGALTLGFAHRWHEAKGSSRVYQNDKVYLDFEAVLSEAHHLTAELVCSHEWRNYRAPATASGAGKRQDDTDDINLKLSWKFLHQPKPGTSKQTPLEMSWIASYDFSDKRSNRKTSEYDDSTFFTGLKVAF